MKSFAAVLLLVSGFAYAGTADMALDAAHKLNFNGCDEAISEAYAFPGIVQADASWAQNVEHPHGEIRIYTVEQIRNGNLIAIKSFRLVGQRCISSNLGNIVQWKDSCKKLRAEADRYFQQIGNVGALVYQGQNGTPSQVLVDNGGAGGCVAFRFPSGDEVH